MKRKSPEAMLAFQGGLTDDEVTKMEPKDLPIPGKEHYPGEHIGSFGKDTDAAEGKITIDESIEKTLDAELPPGFADIEDAMSSDADGDVVTRTVT